MFQQQIKKNICRRIEKKIRKTIQLFSLQIKPKKSDSGTLSSECKNQIVMSIIFRGHHENESFCEFANSQKNDMEAKQVEIVMPLF